MPSDLNLGRGIRIVLDPDTGEAVPADSTRGTQLLASYGQTARASTTQFIMPPRIELDQIAAFARVSPFGPMVLVMVASWQRKIGPLPFSLLVCACIGISTRTTRSRLIAALCDEGLIVHINHGAKSQTPILALSPALAKALGVPDHSGPPKPRKPIRTKWRPTVVDSGRNT